MFSLGGSTVTGVSGVSVIPVAMVVEPGDGSDTPVTSVSIVFIDLSGG